MPSQKLAPEELEASVTVVAVVVVTGFPKASSWVTVIGPKAALFDAVPDTPVPDATDKASFAAGAGRMVTETGGLVAETFGFESTAWTEYVPAAVKAASRELDDPV